MITDTTARTATTTNTADAVTGLCRGCQRLMKDTKPQANRRPHQIDRRMTIHVEAFPAIPRADVTSEGSHPAIMSITATSTHVPRTRPMPNMTRTSCPSPGGPSQGTSDKRAHSLGADPCGCHTLASAFLKYAIVRSRPSASGVLGSQPSVARARVISG